MKKLLLLCLLLSFYVQPIHSLGNVFVVNKDYLRQLKENINPTQVDDVFGYDFPVITNPDDVMIIVNKQVQLSAEYEPNDLVEVDVFKVGATTNKQMRKVAADALKELFEKAKRQGYTLAAISGYRSYSTQNRIYHNYVANHGQSSADRFSARPGHSEHQLGLAMDISVASIGYSLSERLAETPEGFWVRHNAHYFGFIIRYPQGKEPITGYMYEPWHLRYVGVELATQIYLCDCTMEEYYFMVSEKQ